MQKDTFYHKQEYVEEVEEIEEQEAKKRPWGMQDLVHVVNAVIGW